MSSLSIAPSGGGNGLVTSNALVNQGKVLAFSVNIPAQSGGNNLIQLGVSEEINGQVLSLTELSFLSVTNIQLLVEVLTTELPSPPPPPPQPIGDVALQVIVNVF